MPDLLALDPSSTRTGYAYFLESQLIDCGAMTTKRHVTDPLQRITSMCEDVEEFLAQFPVEDVIIEMVSGRTSYGNKTPRTSLAVQAWACGAIWHTCKASGGMSCCPPVSEVTWTRGRSKADRQQEIAMIYPKPLYDAAKDRGGDVSDAIGLGLWWMDQCREIAFNMTPDWTSKDGSVELYCGDCLDILPHLSGVDAVVTDPPYGMDEDTDRSRFTQGPNGHGAASLAVWPKVVGDDRPFDPSPFLDFDGVVLFGSNHFAQRLPVGTTLVWIKRSEVGFGSFLSDAEIAWRKGGHGVYCRRDTSMYSKPERRHHPCEKPINIMRWAISFTSGTVLDPFMGSGTTGVACVRLGRRFIGIEKEPKYFAIAVRRIEEAFADGGLFNGEITKLDLWPEIAST